MLMHSIDFPHFAVPHATPQNELVADNKMIHVIATMVDLKHISIVPFSTIEV